MKPHFVLVKATERNPHTITTAALVMCFCCGHAVDSRGGPKLAICERCVEWVRRLPPPEDDE